MIFGKFSAAKLEYFYQQNAKSGWWPPTRLASVPTNKLRLYNLVSTTLFWYTFELIIIVQKNLYILIKRNFIIVLSLIYDLFLFYIGFYWNYIISLSKCYQNLVGNQPYLLVSHPFMNCVQEIWFERSCLWMRSGIVDFSRPMSSRWMQ